MKKLVRKHWKIRQKQITSSKSGKWKTRQKQEGERKKEKSLVGQTCFCLKCIRSHVDARDDNGVLKSCRERERKKRIQSNVRMMVVVLCRTISTFFALSPTFCLAANTKLHACEQKHGKCKHSSRRDDKWFVCIVHLAKAFCFFRYLWHFHLRKERRCWKKRNRTIKYDRMNWVGKRGKRNSEWKQCKWMRPKVK